MRALLSERWRRCAFTASILAAALPQVAHAGAFQVDPVIVELNGSERAATVSVRNASAEPVTIRATLLRWTQVDGDDVYTPTDAIIASPPVFTVAGSQTQLLRVGPRAAVPDGAYRIMLEEIPRANASHNGVAVTLRLNLPFYVHGANGGAPLVRWSAWREADGDLVIEGANDGTRPAPVTQITAIDPAGHETILSRRMGVALPHGMKRWNAGAQPAFRTGSHFSITVRGPLGATQDDVVLQAR